MDHPHVNIAYTECTVLKFFYHSGFLNNFALALKNRVCLGIFHCIQFAFTFRTFEQFALALKNRVSLKIFTVLKIFLSFRIFEQLCTCPETEFALKIFTVLYILLHSGFLSNLRLP